MGTLFVLDLWVFLRSSRELGYLSGCFTSDVSIVVVRMWALVVWSSALSAVSVLSSSVLLSVR